MNVRKAVFAGSWYPGSAQACEKEIKQFVDSSQKEYSAELKLLGGIVPHAGWFYSGAIACEVIASLSSDPAPDLVIVFGMHLHKSSSAYIMTEGAWETPFGPLEIDQEVAGELAQKYPFRIETHDRYTQDNTIELQLPFIKYFLGEAKLVPIGAPPTSKSLSMGKEAAAIATRLGRQVKIIGSTDLTHYGSNYGFTPKGSGPEAHEWVRKENDRLVIEPMLKMDAEAVLDVAGRKQNACCAGAAATAIASLKTLGAERGEILTYATSYEKSPGESFVGYAGIVF